MRESTPKPGDIIYIVPEVLDEEDEYDTAAVVLENELGLCYVYLRDNASVCDKRDDGRYEGRPLTYQATRLERGDWSWTQAGAVEIRIANELEYATNLLAEIERAKVYVAKTGERGDP